MDTWLPIPLDGFEHYQVSDSGRVRNSDRGFRVLTERSFNYRGYRIQTLVSNSGDKKTFAIHTLVAYAFIGERPYGYEICHNDGDKVNNHFSNLRYDTPAGNRLDWIKAGKPNKRKYGVSFRKRVNIKQRHILKCYLISHAKTTISNGALAKDAAGEIGLSESMLSKYINGKIGKRLEYILEYT